MPTALAEREPICSVQAPAISYGVSSTSSPPAERDPQLRIRLVAPSPVEDRRDLRTMYARLARQYDQLPAVPDLGGGLPGEIDPI